MYNFNLTFFSQYFSKNATLAFLILLSICTLIFIDHSLPGLWMVFATVEVAGFFYFSNILTKRWASLSSKTYKHKLFWLSLTIRVAWVVFSYYFFIATTGKPFEFATADAVSYHNWASFASDTFSVMGFRQFFESRMGYSDLGYPIYLTIIYLIFGKSIIIARLLFALWSSLTCLLIYQIARRNFGESAGRIAGILAMLLPNFIYYTGLHLKEPLMVFLIVAFIERADFMLQIRQIKINNVIVLALLGTFLFFFRTMLGICAFFALFSTLIFSLKRSGSLGKHFLIGLWIMVFFGLFLAPIFQKEFNLIIEKRHGQSINMQWRADREGGNKFAIYGSEVVFAPVMLIVPFPTLVNIKYQKQIMMLSGAYFIKNVYAIFVIFGLFLLIKHSKCRKHLLILVFTFAYLGILTKSPYALSERFHMPVAPFLLVIAAFGVTQVNKKFAAYFIPYLVLILAMIIFWNWFKLAGRGMI